MFILDPTLRRTSVMSMEGDDIVRHKREHAEGNLKLYDQRLECEREVMCVRFSHDGSVIAVGQANGIIKIFNPENGAHLHSLVPPGHESDDHLPVTALRFRIAAWDAKVEHTHVLIATYASGCVRQWHYTSGKCLSTRKECRQTLAAALDPSGQRLATAADDSNLRVYDVETMTELRTLEASDARDIMDGHKLRVFSVQYHPVESHLLISGGWDDTVQFWDDRVKHAVRKLFGPHISGDSLDIDGLHNHIVTGSWRKHDVLQIWDFASGKKIKDVPQDPLQGSLLYCCQWLGRDNIVCGGTDANMARIIDRGTLNTVGQLVDLPNGVFSIDNDRQGNSPCIAVGAACTCYIMQVERHH